MDGSGSDRLTDVLLACCRAWAGSMRYAMAMTNSYVALAADLRDCLSELLGLRAPEVPGDSEPLRFFRQWLAERNLGLVPIADPASFDWAGQWIAIVDGSEAQHAVVMFGSPSGVWLDPAGVYGDGARITGGWMLTPLDLHLLHLPGQRPYG